MYITRRIRNNWSTEKMSELELTNNTDNYVARLNDLKELYKLE